MEHHEKYEAALMDMTQCAFIRSEEEVTQNKVLDDGEHAANLEYGTVGIRLAQNLGIGAQWDGFLKIYAPKKQGQLDMTNHCLLYTSS